MRLAQFVTPGIHPDGKAERPGGRPCGLDAAVLSFDKVAIAVGLFCP